MTGRLLVPVDTYMLLERDGKLLMLRRAPSAAYAAGLLCPPSGHVGRAARLASRGTPCHPFPAAGQPGLLDPGYEHELTLLGGHHTAEAHAPDPRPGTGGDAGLDEAASP